MKTLAALVNKVRLQPNEDGASRLMKRICFLLTFSHHDFFISEASSFQKRTFDYQTKVRFWLARPKRHIHCGFALCTASSTTAARRQYPSRTSRLKIVRRTVFLTPLALSEFEPLLKEKEHTLQYALLLLARPKRFELPVVRIGI